MVLLDLFIADGNEAGWGSDAGWLLVALGLFLFFIVLPVVLFGLAVVVTIRLFQRLSDEDFRVLLSLVGLLSVVLTLASFLNAF
jgi:hypothetical protein